MVRILDSRNQMSRVVEIEDRRKMFGYHVQSQPQNISESVWDCDDSEEPEDTTSSQQALIDALMTYSPIFQPNSSTLPNDNFTLTDDYSSPDYQQSSNDAVVSSLHIPLQSLKLTSSNRSPSTSPSIKGGDGDYEDGGNGTEHPAVDRSIFGSSSSSSPMTTVSAFVPKQHAVDTNIEASSSPSIEHNIETNLQRSFTTLPKSATITLAINTDIISSLPSFNSSHLAPSPPPYPPHMSRALSAEPLNAYIPSPLFLKEPILKSADPPVSRLSRQLNDPYHQHYDRHRDRPSSLSLSPRYSCTQPLKKLASNIKVFTHPSTDPMIVPVRTRQTVLDFIATIISQYVSENRQPSLSTTQVEAYELRMLDDEDDGTPDEDMPSLALDREFAEYRIDAVALCECVDRKLSSVDSYSSSISMSSVSFASTSVRPTLPLSTDISSSVTPENFLFTYEVASTYSEYRVIKTNERGKRQLRMLGIDGGMIYNKHVTKSGHRRRLLQVMRAFRPIHSVQSVFIHHEKLTKFTICYREKNKIITRDYEAETTMECAEIVAKIRFLTSHSQKASLSASERHFR